MSKTMYPDTESLLRLAVISGAMLLVFFGLAFGGIYATGRIVPGQRGSGFHAMLGEYDFRYRRIEEMGLHAALRQELDGLENELNRLERRTEGVESWLSVLKRRRQLAAFDPHYRRAYAQSTRRAADAFPHSGPIAAVAAAAMVYDTAITREDEAVLRDMLPLLYDSRLVPVRVSLHVLLGDFAGPRRGSSVLPEVSGLLNDLPPGYAAMEPFQAIFADLAILKILAGDSAGAASDIRFALGSGGADSIALSPGLIRLAAEYSYDFGDLLRSAELFSMLPDDAALGRQADALWLAGYADSARALWAMQADRPEALYNLALTARTQEEAASLLGRIAAQDGKDNPSRDFGLIRYSRLFEPRQAIAILEGGKDPAAASAAGAASTAVQGTGQTVALIDLEILKRRTEVGEMARVIAETWMLLERFPEAEHLYHWGAWLFNLQRSYAETALLIRAAERQSFEEDWLVVYGALHQIREGNLDAAEEMLAAAVRAGGSWEAYANLGRILEARRAPSRAMANYELALAAVEDKNTASQIYVRIASCLRVLGRDEESRAALQTALELNPDNLRARMGMSRR